MANKPVVSIGWIIFWFIVFFPVGVVLLIIRVLPIIIDFAKDAETIATSNKQDPWTKVLPMEPKEKTVTCKGCGARTLIENGKAKECEYCGSLVK